MSLRHVWLTCVIIVGIIQLSLCAKIRIYCGYDWSLHNYKEAELSKAVTLLNYEECYDSSKDNFFWIFGFAGSVDGNATVNVMKTMFSFTKEFNLFVFNWQKEAASLFTTDTALDLPIKELSYFVSGIPKTFEVAAEFGNALVEMSKHGFCLECTHLVGHSLGAHLAGKAGRTALQIAGNPVGWVIALDPAGPVFSLPLVDSVKQGDASGVLCLHTDPGDYGTNKTGCGVDLFANYLAFMRTDETKRVQPGCPEGSFTKFSTEDLCSHNRAWMLFIEAVQYATLTGSKAGTVWDWLRGLGDCSDTVPLSLDWDTKKTGLYFMHTAASPQYGLGVAGACPSAY